MNSLLKQGSSKSQIRRMGEFHEFSLKEIFSISKNILMYFGLRNCNIKLLSDGNFRVGQGGRKVMKKAAAVFSILMGVMLLGTWGYLFISNNYPEASTFPLETGYLLVAEFLTGAALIAGGYGILASRRWGLPLILVALGELVYCTVRFAGELGQGGSVPGLAFFTTVAALGIIFAVYLIVTTSWHKQTS